MTDEQGTPKTLEEAIAHGLMVGASFTEIRAHLRLHLKDFIAQKFQVAYLKAEEMPNGQEVSDLLEQLYGALTK